MAVIVVPPLPRHWLPHERSHRRPLTGAVVVLVASAGDDEDRRRGVVVVSEEEEGWVGMIRVRCSWLAKEWKS